MLKDRAAGVLLHITSLPSIYGSGDLGPEAYKFVDFLAKSKLKLWQILPLNPVSAITGYSPYSSDSAFAGNIILISPDLLVSDGFISETELLKISTGINFEQKEKYILKLLAKAFTDFKKQNVLAKEYKEFIKKEKYWIEDYSLFKVLRKKFKNQPWYNWEDDYKHRDKKSLDEFKLTVEDEIEKIKFYQFIFYHQWNKLKEYCNKNNIKIIGDIPYYVAADSVDVWTKPKIFKLDRNKKPEFVSGVPPDYFSKTGQLWGNPVYDWQQLKKEKYKWWTDRLQHNLKLVDWLRLDHFRAFSAYWEVPAAEKTAVNGKWVEVPGNDFFNKLKYEYKKLSLIAEDLGDIDDAVRKLIKDFKFPGMKVLQFAFDHKINNSPDAPHKHVHNGVVYTGTHDNPTTRAWYNGLIDEDREKINSYTGIKVNEKNVAGNLIRLAMMSVASWSIIPMQDFLNLGDEATMNRPGTSEGNWKWQLMPDQLTDKLAAALAGQVEMYDRA